MVHMARTNDDCPVCRTAEIVCGKWTLLVIRDLAEGRSRFCELERSLAGISPRTLSLRLRALEEEGIVERHTFAEVPPRVEYSLTEKGRALLPDHRGHARVRPPLARRRGARTTRLAGPPSPPPEPRCNARCAGEECRAPAANRRCMRNSHLHQTLRAFAEESAHQLAAELAQGAEVPFELTESPGRPRRPVLLPAAAPTSSSARRSGTLGRLPSYAAAAQALERLGGLDAYLRVRGERAHARDATRSAPTPRCARSSAACSPRRPTSSSPASASSAPTRELEEALFTAAR